MSQADQTLSSLFNPVTEPAEQQRFLEDALKGRVALTLWTQGKEHVLRPAYLVRWNKDEGLEFASRSEAAVKEFEEKLRAGDSVCYANYGLAKGSVFFTGRLVAGPTPEKKKSIQITYPKEFFNVQRRMGIRLPIRPPYSLFAEYRLIGEIDTLKRKITDISIGGIAFLTDPKEADKYPTGEMISRLSFIVRSRQITCTCVVRHTRVITKETGPQLLVGVQFESLPKKEVAIIDKFVIDESQQMFTTLVGKR